MININLFNEALTCKREMSINSIASDKSQDITVPIEKLSIPITKDIIDNLEQLQCVLPKLGKQVLEATIDKLPKITPYGLSIPLLPESTTGNLKLAYEACCDEMPEEEDPVNRYKVNTILLPVENDPIEDINIRAILGSKCCGKNKKVKKEITKDVITESVDFLNNIENILKDLITEAEKLYTDRCSEVNIFNHTVDRDEASLGFKATICNKEILDYFYLKGKKDNIEKCFQNSCNIIGTVSSYDPSDISGTLEEALIAGEYMEFQAKCVIESSEMIDTGKYYLEEGVKENLEKLRMKMVRNDEKFLKKYKEKALKSSCAGIVIEKWFVPRSDLETKYSNAKKEFEKVFKTDYKSYEELKKAYDLCKDDIFVKLGLTSNAASTHINSEFLDKKQLTSTKKLSLSAEDNHKVTPADVKTALNIMKTSPKMISELKIKVSEANAKVAFGADSSTTIGKGKNEKLIMKMDRMKRSGMNLLESNYAKAKLTQLTILRQQARLVIMKAARVTDKNIKEEVMSYINDDLYITESAFNLIFK